jgi:hypothetical protein
LPTHLEAGDPRVFPPIVATHLVKLACELPDDRARSLSTWTCAELAKTLTWDQIVDSISPSSVQRILAAQKLKPWRVHHWLSSEVPRDEVFRQAVRNICTLYTRPLGAHERVLCIDEKTSLQPRTRTAASRPARAPNEPVRVEHEYVRKGALNLFAAFDTRTGEVTGILRQVEFIEQDDGVRLRTRAWQADVADGHADHGGCDQDYDYRVPLLEWRSHKLLQLCRWLRGSDVRRARMDGSCPLCIEIAGGRMMTT